MGYVVAVVGATGVVGREMIAILDESSLPIDRLVLLASEKSAGMSILFRGEQVSVTALTDSAFVGVDYALFSAGGSVSARFAPIAAQQGCVVIDNSSHFRMDPSVPLVVPEVNPHDAQHHAGIIANPNCSTAQLVMILKPILDHVGLTRVSVATYQSVSGAGKGALLELENQSRANLNGTDYPPKVFGHPIAFNVIPHIDSFLENGYTKEEMKVTNETRKLLGTPTLPVAATAVRVPVFIGHSEVVTLQTERSLTVEEAKTIWQHSAGVVVMDDPTSATYPTPRELAGKNEVAVGRIRLDLSQENGLVCWCVGDNLRKGAALNAVQILQLLTHSNTRMIHGA